MYICEKENHPNYNFVKCQTLKPYMIGNDTFQHYCDEKPDIQRNPFKRTTRIDCDKLFLTTNVDYHQTLRTTARPDVCEELLKNVRKELKEDGYSDISVKTNELIQLNPLVREVTSDSDDLGSSI